MKKFVSIVLAVLMVMSLTTVALAADNKITASGDNTLTKNTQVALNGKITDDAVLLSVVMPTGIDFTIGTTATSNATVNEKNTANASENASGGNIFSTLISGSGTVTNNSNVDIKLEITDVADKSDLLKKVDLAVVSDELDETTAMKAPLEAKDYSASPIVLASKLAATNGTTTLTVAGKGCQGQYSGLNKDVNLDKGNYVVTTTLKISVA